MLHDAWGKRDTNVISFFVSKRVRVCDNSTCDGCHDDNGKVDRAISSILVYRPHPDGNKPALCFPKLFSYRQVIQSAKMDSERERERETKRERKRERGGEQSAF